MTQNCPLPTDFLSLARRRRSVRCYRPDPVPEELLQQVLEAGRWAPSACNTQPWEFIVVTSPEVRQVLYELATVVGLKWPHLRTAPVVIVLCGQRLTPYSRDDCIFAAQNMLLCAADLGLGTCYIGGFNEAKVRRALSVPQGYLLPGMITLGYPDHDPSPPPHRALAEMVHRDTYASRGLDLSHLSRFLGFLSRYLRLHRRKP